MSAPLNVKVWSDYVCPWCYVGQTELQSLKSEFPNLQLEWRPFLLRPDAPPEGVELPQRIRDLMKDPNNPLTQRVKKLGLPFVHREKIPNSRKAHEATAYATLHGKQEAFHHAVMKHYWAMGEDLSSETVLKAAATEAGLDADALWREVETGKFRSEVDESIAQAEDGGITGVPFFVLADRYVISGAQEASVFRQALKRIESEAR